MADAERVRHIYERQAARYDQATRSRTLDGIRTRLLARARGRVLEVGVGTGLTFQHYPRAVESLLGLDLSEAMLAQARSRAAALPFPVELRLMDVAEWRSQPGSFDTVVSSLALCGPPDPVGLLSRLRESLRPGGQLLAMEHVRPAAPLGLLADALDPLFDRVVGCHWNRPTARLLADAGFRVEVLERHYAGALVSLVATPRG